MTVDSQRSKQKPAARDNQDPDRGYVSVQEMQNVFTERLRQLDAEIWPRGERMPSRDEMLEFFSTMKIELFQRAGRNYAEYCKRNPEPRKPTAPQAQQASDELSRSEYENRKSRLSRFHT